MKKIAIAIAAIFALSMTACGGNDSSAPTATVTVTASPSATPTETPDAPEPSDSPTLSQGENEDVFLKVLRHGTNGWDNSDDSKVIALADSVCKGWKAGLTLNRMGGILVKAGYSAHDAGFFIGDATEAFCPEFSDQISGGSNA